VADGEFDSGGDGESDVAVLMGSAERRLDLDVFAENFKLVGGVG